MGHIDLAYVSLTSGNLTQTLVVRRSITPEGYICIYVVSPLPGRWRYRTARSEQCYMKKIGMPHN